MILIGICGGTNSGKTTITKKLLEILPNAICIQCDIYMFENTKKYQDEIFKNLGVEKAPNIIDRDYFYANYENVKMWINTISPYIIDSIKSELNKNRDKLYAIIDWCYLPLCSIFDECNIKIVVQANEDERFARIKSRFSEKDHIEQYEINEWSKETYFNRIKYTKKASDRKKV